MDVTDSGFAYVLYKILRIHGLERGVDYEVVSIGGTFQRFQALMAGTIDGTLLFIQAYYKALLWVLDPANREEAISFLVNATTPRALAEQFYETELRESDGLIRDAGIDLQGLLNVLALREEFGGFEQPQDLGFLVTPESGLYDLRYLRRAVDDLDDDASDGVVE